MPQVPTHPPTHAPAQPAVEDRTPEPTPGAKERKAYATYVPDLCAKIVKFMDQGFSRSAFAGEIGVSYETLLTWMRENPEFAEAGERGRAGRTRFLEAQFLEGGTGAKVAAHVFALKNAAPEDWRDRPEPPASEQGPTVIFTLPDNGRG